MSQEVLFNHENPVTVHDILWSWSQGYMTTKEAVSALHLDDEMELYEAANDNDVPFPGSPSESDVQMAEEFVKAISKVA